MADVFLSYAQEDRTRARKLADALRERGWDVWWDAHVYVGTRFRSEIARQLQSAKCVVVLWSRASIESDWVIDEAQDGKNRGVLVQALIDDVSPPHGFRGIHWANLNSWSGDLHAEEFVKLAGGISRHATISAPTPAATPQPRQPDPPPPTPIDSGAQAGVQTVRWRLGTDSLAAAPANRRRLIVGGVGVAITIATMLYVSSLPTEQAPQVDQVASPTPTVSSPSSASPADAAPGQNGGDKPTPSTDRSTRGDGRSSAPRSPATTPANELSKPSESDRSRSSSPALFGEHVANWFSANTTTTPSAKPSPPASNNSTGALQKADCPSWTDNAFSPVDFVNLSSGLGDSGRATVERVATFWKKNEGLNKGSFIDVTIYERPPSTTRTISAENMASSVNLHFAALGIPPDRIRVHPKTLPPECRWGGGFFTLDRGRVTFAITTSYGIRVAPYPDSR